MLPIFTHSSAGIDFFFHLCDYRDAWKDIFIFPEQFMLLISLRILDLRYNISKVVFSTSSKVGVGAAAVRSNETAAF